jgi:hypothetical protein
MYFTEKVLAEFAAEREAINARYAALYDRFLSRRYVSERGKEFGHHGILRRLQSLKRCITNIYRLLPPECNEIPDDDTRHDAELQVQASVFHTFGAADNLAWIWVSEKNIRNIDGSPLRDGAIGIRKDKVRASFTPEFRAYLDEREPWFDYLEDFRHALAHRIPLYIPPHVVTPANAASYQELERQMRAAAGRMDFTERERLKAEQRQLTFFRPWMQHSFIEEADPVAFHSQMLADFNTIDEMANKMLDELGA